MTDAGRLRAVLRAWVSALAIGLVLCGASMAQAASAASAAAAASVDEAPTVHYTEVEGLVAPMGESETLADLLRQVGLQRPPEAAAWTPVSLPELVPRAAVTVASQWPDSTMRWYRVRHPGGGSAAAPLGLYLPRVVSGPMVVLWRQGEGWRVLSKSDQGLREEWNRPFLLSLPETGGAPFEIALGISVGSYRIQHTVSTIWIGPLDEVRRRAEWRVLAQLQAPMATSTAILIVGLFAAGVWWRRRHERAYLYFALAAMVWSFRNLHYYIELPRNEVAWNWFWWATNSSLGWVMLLVYGFALRFDGRGHRRMELLLLGGVLVASLINVPLWPHLLDALQVQHAVNALVALTVTLYMSLLCWRGAGPELRAITLASWICQAFGIHDLLLLGGRITPETIYLLPYAPLVVFASFLYATLRRYVQAIEQVEGANEQLEARLREREAELEANHARLRSVEREQALLLERERLMADMHDGIGSTLMSALIMLEHGQIDREGVAGLMRECVDDLRLVIDSLEPIENDLGQLLATLRYRLGRRLEAAGVALEWSLDEKLPLLPWLSPPDALQVLRLLQEVLTNVLKHAGAQRVQMSTRLMPDAMVEVRVQDDGCGFDPAAAASRGGRGLGNLKLRARKLRATLDVDSAPGRGTTVRLLLPVERPAT
jgi:signal transduction histidine kinase